MPKISALPVADTLTGEEIIPGVQAGATVGMRAAEIAALATATASGFPAPQTLAYASTVTIAAPSSNTGPLACSLTMTGDAALALTGAPVDGQVVGLNILASAGARALTLPSSVVIPSSSSLASPITIASGTMSSLGLRWSALRAKWVLTAYVPGA